MTSSPRPSPPMVDRPPFLSPGRVASGAVAVLYTLAAAIGAVATGNGEFIFYIIVMVVLAAIITLIHWNLRLSTGLLWGLVIWGGLHMAGGLIPVPESWPIHGDVRVLYSWWIIPPGMIAENGAEEGASGLLKYDHVVHVFGYGVTAILCWEALRAIAVRQGAVLRPTFGVLVLIVCAASGLGAFNEIIEFIATRLGPTNVGGYLNTALDLIANTIGAVLAAMGIGMVSRMRGEEGREEESR